MEVEAVELHRALCLFHSSVLIMDEVDLLLHPLQSDCTSPSARITVRTPPPPRHSRAFVLT